MTNDQVYDPAWDKDDTVNHQLHSHSVDSSAPECPSSQETFSPHVRPQDTQLLADEHKLHVRPHDTSESLSIVEYLEKISGDRPIAVRPHDTQLLADEHAHWIQQYWVKRGSTKHYYYRYCWMVGRKKNCIHIGSVNSAIAKNRKLEVEIAVSDGETPDEIENLIRSWRKS